MLNEGDFWFGVVVNNLPVWDYLRLRAEGDGVGLILDGKVEATSNPVLITARALASQVSQDQYLPARSKYLEKKIENLTKSRNLNYSEDAFSAVAVIDEERDILIAEEAMLKTAVQVLAEFEQAS